MLKPTLSRVKRSQRCDPAKLDAVALSSLSTPAAAVPLPSFAGTMAFTNINHCSRFYDLPELSTHFDGFGDEHKTRSQKWQTVKPSLPAATTAAER